MAQNYNANAEIVLSNQTLKQRKQAKEYLRRIKRSNKKFLESQAQ